MLWPSSGPETQRVRTGSLTDEAEMTKKRHPPRGSSETHDPARGLPIRLSDESDLALFWHEADEWPIEDDRGSLSLSVPVGWIEDRDRSWNLRFLGPAKRRGARRGKHPFYWSSMEPVFRTQRSRRKPVDFTDIMPASLNPAHQQWTPAELRTLRKFTGGRSPETTAERRVWTRLQCWDLGIRTVKDIEMPAFGITRHRDGTVSVQLHDGSTATLLLRVIEETLRFGPADNVKYSRIDPLLTAIRWIAAMDRTRFGEAASRCASAYVLAFARVVTEPWRYLCLGSLSNRPIHFDGEPSWFPRTTCSSSVC